MANQANTKGVVRSLGAKSATIDIKFTTNGTSAPTVVYDSCDKKARVTVAAPSPVGVFTVQLPKVGSGFPSEIFAVAGVEDTTGSMLSSQVSIVKASYSRTTGQFQVGYMKSGALATSTGVNITILVRARIGTYGKQQ